MEAPSFQGIPFGYAPDFQLVYMITVIKVQGEPKCRQSL